MSTDAATMNLTNTLEDRFVAVREQTERLAEPLSAEDACVQSMPDTSPVKWHLAHTTWFFETFVLSTQIENYVPFDPQYRFLFNSYYNAIGEQYSRPHRGLLTRPSLAEVHRYRHHVNKRLLELITQDLAAAISDVIEVGLHHEQQHQELLLMDVKHLFSCNPIFPAYTQTAYHSASPPALKYYDFAGGILEIGAEDSRFSFDNERPRHRAFVQEFALGSRLVTNADYLAFIQDGGYTAPLLWLADGWAAIQNGAWGEPLYWREIDHQWYEFTLSGLQPLQLNAPVVHVSYYEADAYARWANARLPTETEWESAAASLPISGNFVDNDLLHPQALGTDAPPKWPQQMFGDVWEWTMSPYMPYPGFSPPEGAIGEYNGKFMSGQMVLRGGACVTPREHIRNSYRNFFYPSNRWQFGGIRLARDQ
jgi:ergothioneine biosynthesis protein EgtB